MAGLLDGLINGILNVVQGPDTSAMDEKDRADTERKRASDRQTAASQAFGAMNDQGESYIDGSKAVQAADSKSSLLESIGKVFSLFK